MPYILRKGEVMVTARITDLGYVITGHANYDEYGYDVVCAGISALTQTIALALQRYCKAKVQATSGWLTVDVEEPDDVSNVLLHALKMGLDNISMEYPEHLQIRVKRGVF